MVALIIAARTLVVRVCCLERCHLAACVRWKVECVQRPRKEDVRALAVSKEDRAKITMDRAR